MQDCRWFDGLVNSGAIGSRWLDDAIDVGLCGMLCNIGQGEDWDATLATAVRVIGQVRRDHRLALARDPAELRQILGSGRVAVVLACDQSAMIGADLWKLEVLSQLGVRHIHLCYMYGELFGDGCGERRDAGLTHLGRAFIAVVNDLPLMLDLSHCGRRTAAEALELARLPVFTHTAADAVHANRRNRTDDEVQAMASKGGVVGVWNLPRSFAVGPAAVEQYVDHLEHLVMVAGIGHVGIGLDVTPELEEALAAGEPIPPGVRQHFERCPDIYGTPAEFATGRLAGFASHADIANVATMLRARGFDDEARQRLLLDNWSRLLSATVDG